MNTTLETTHKFCPVGATAEIIGRKWVLLIVRDLMAATCRFNELQHSLGASPRILAQRLQEMEALGLVHRQCYAEVPPRVEYSLTEKGRKLLPVIEAMREFGEGLIGAGGV